MYIKEILKAPDLSKIHNFWDIEFTQKIELLLFCIGKYFYDSEKHMNRVEIYAQKLQNDSDIYKLENLLLYKMDFMMNINRQKYILHSAIGDNILELIQAVKLITSAGIEKMIVANLYEPGFFTIRELLLANKYQLKIFGATFNIKAIDNFKLQKNLNFSVQIQIIT